MAMRIVLANPRGFCAGVDRAIEIVERALQLFGAPIYVRHEVVHNRNVVERLQVRSPERLAFVTQTTLSVDDTAAILAALKRRFPALQAPRHEDICYATQNRQDAVKAIIERCNVLVVVGSRSSSNSNRLRELADRAGIPGYLVDGADDLKRSWFDGCKAVGVTAGASAPELLVQQVIARLREWGGQTPQELTGREERVVFALPRALRV